MKTIVKIWVPVLALAVLTTGCYTKFYRSGMEQPGSPYGQIYNRHDSTAIDTTLTREDWAGPDTYPESSYYNNWSSWGWRRGYPRWGFDFNNFSPDYYWSYYGYNDYYSTPWWYNSYWDPWHRGPGWYYGSPGEPPSQRERGRREPGGIGGSPSAPPPPPSVASPSSPAPPAPPPQRKDGGNTDQKQGSDDNKRGGRRGR